MALKLDWQYWRDEDGNIVLGDLSFVTCAPDDPHRMTVVNIPEPEKDREKKP
jgi:hypothetical protein